MVEYIDKTALVAEIERRLEKIANASSENNRELFAIYGAQIYELVNLAQYINTLEVKDSYEQCVQYDSIKAGIQAHAETYSFNIESELFNQLTKEQQKLWRKEIEQAVISGGEAGVELSNDVRYKENLEVKEVDLEEVHYKPLDEDFERDAVSFCFDSGLNTTPHIAKTIAKHFFELGLKAQKGE